jgi:PleD family two-component response regulator
VLSKTDKDRAVNVIENLKRELNALMAEHSWQVIFSIGLAIFSSVPNSEDQIISFTDQLMYRVKSSGKNYVLTEAFAMRGL